MTRVKSIKSPPQFGFHYHSQFRWADWIFRVMRVAHPASKANSCADMKIPRKRQHVWVMNMSYNKVSENNRFTIFTSNCVIIIPWKKKCKKFISLIKTFPILIKYTQHFQLGEFLGEPCQFSRGVIRSHFRSGKSFCIIWWILRWNMFILRAVIKFHQIYTDPTSKSPKISPQTIRSAIIPTWPKVIAYRPEL